MYLENDGLVIRNAVRDDAEKLAEWWNDGIVMAHAGFPLGLNTTVEKINDDISTDRDDTRRRLIMTYQGQPIGEMSYRNRNDGSAELGIKICEQEYQNRRLGRKALKMLISELFEMGYERIVLDTNLKNTRAQHVYELLGFRMTGIRYDNWQDQLGVFQSTVYYEMNREELQ